MSSNRYSALNRRPAATSSLFSDYPGNTTTSRPTSSTSHTRPTYAYPSRPTSSPRPSSPYHNHNTNPNSSPYTQSNGYTSSPYTNNSHPTKKSNGKQSPPPNPSSSPSYYSDNNNSTTTYHQATPNSKGQYSTSVLESLESQNANEATSMLSAKVSQLKTLTVAIGEEIRDSSKLAGQINDSFENTGAKLKGTARRMLRMAERTGVGWRVWLVFFVVVWLLFAYVWLF